jgi:hypothetical protein
MVNIARLDASLGDEKPYQAKDCITVLDTQLDAMSDDDLLQLHQKHNIHVVPKVAPECLPFKVETCQAIGVNVDLMHEVHGK